MTLNVSLTPQLEDMVRQKVASGLYTSASEVIREALRTMELQDRMREEKRAHLKQLIQEGEQSGISITPPDDFFEVLTKKYAAKAAKK